MLSSRGKSESLLYNVVDDKLTCNNHADMDNTGTCSGEEGRDSTLVVNVLDNSEETLAAASLERLRQDHISGLAENTSKQAGNKRGRDRNDPFEIIGSDSLFLGKGRIEQPSNNIERNLLSHGVRNLHTFRFMCVVCAMRN